MFVAGSVVLSGNDCYSIYGVARIVKVTQQKSSRKVRLRMGRPLKKVRPEVTNENKSEARGRVFRLDLELDRDLESFTDRTQRDMAHTIRAILRLALKDGEDVLELRLVTRLWDPAPGAPDVDREAVRRILRTAAGKAGLALPPSGTGSGRGTGRQGA